MSHGYTVALRGKNVAGQQIRRLQVLSLGKAVPARIGIREKGQKLRVGVVASHRACELLREEQLNSGGKLPAGQMGKKRTPQVLGTGAEELLKIRRRQALNVLQV